MFASTQRLLQTAEILEKVAEVFELEELEVQHKHAEAIQKDFIAPIKETVDELPEELETKLANTDPDVLSFFKDHIGTKSKRGYTPWGAPDTTKVASEETDPLLAFCMGED